MRRQAAQAGTILALGILSIVVFCGFGPVAWAMGKAELARIDRGELPESGRAMVQAGYVCGVVGTCILALLLALLLLAASR